MTTESTATSASFTRTDSDFSSQGVRCSGWLYRPAGIEKPPVVVMGCFLGGEKTFRLPAYAEHFANHGLAVFLFDYRNFGGSDGEPRNLIDPWRHLQDWRAALAHVRGLPEVDGTRLALWGSSFAGGHVLKIAAEDHAVTAVVAQVPAVDGLASTLMRDWRYLATAVGAGLRDWVVGTASGRPYCQPIVGSPERFAILNTPESEPGYLALADPDSAWENKTPARLLLQFPFYRPGASAGQIQCPTLILAAEQDSLIPLRAVEKTAERIAKVTLVRLSCDHFTPYVGENFAQNVKTMTDFLLRQLQPEGGLRR